MEGFVHCYNGNYLAGKEKLGEALFKQKRNLNYLKTIGDIEFN